MSCRKSEIRSLIFEYVDGTLSVESARRVAEHLEECSECRALHLDYQSTIAGLRAVFEGDATEHIPNETLVDFVSGPETLSDADRESIELHLTVCTACEQKAEMLRKVTLEESSIPAASTNDSSLALFPRLVRSFQQKPGIGIASVGLAAAALLIICLVTIGRDPGTAMFVAPSADVVWLSESTRGEQVPPSIHEKNGWVNIGARFHAFFDEESYEIRMQSADGTTISSVVISREDYSDFGVRLRIRTSSLDPGVVRLMLETCELSDETSCVRTAFKFTLVRE